MSAVNGPETPKAASPAPEPSSHEKDDRASSSSSTTTTTTAAATSKTPTKTKLKPETKRELLALFGDSKKNRKRRRASTGNIKPILRKEGKGGSNLDLPAAGSGHKRTTFASQSFKFTDSSKKNDPVSLRSPTAKKKKEERAGSEQKGKDDNEHGITWNNLYEDSTESAPAIQVNIATVSSETDLFSNVGTHQVSDGAAEGNGSQKEKDQDAKYDESQEPKEPTTADEKAQQVSTTTQDS